MVLNKEDITVLKNLHLNPALRLVNIYANEHMRKPGFLYKFKLYREYKTYQLFEKLVDAKLLRKEQDKVIAKSEAYYLTFDGIKESLKTI